MSEDLRTALASAVDTLAAAGVGSPWADAQALAAHALGVSRGELSRLVVLGAPAPDGLAALVARRAARVPLQHLVGRAGFRTIEVLVGPGVFVPRPETEVVAGLAIEAAADVEDPLVVDLCTGSGAIALAIAAELPRSSVIGVELDATALGWARRSLARLTAVGVVDAARVDLREGDATDERLLAEVAGAVDVVVANPPYIPPDAEPIDPEARDHDPALALYGGGDDGLAVPRAVVAAAGRLLRGGGHLVMEHADIQGAAARDMVAGGAWEAVHTVADLVGRPRALVARRA